MLAMGDGAGTDEQTIQIRLTLGHAGDGDLDVRVSPFAAEELKADLEEHGVFNGNILEFSAVSTLAIYAASIGSGGAGLAAALTAFFHRNRHKRIEITTEKGAVKVTGLSKDDAMTVMTHAVNEMIRAQAENDAAWVRALGKDEPTEQ